MSTTATCHQRPPVNNSHYFWVPRGVVVHRFDCIFILLDFYPIEPNLPSACDCDAKGTIEEVCDKSNGQCLCKEGFGGPRCDRCEPGWFDYPTCTPCECADVGSGSAICDQVNIPLMLLLLLLLMSLLLLLLVMFFCCCICCCCCFVVICCCRLLLFFMLLLNGVR